MNGRHVALLFRKEFIDLLRDKRTLISMILAPMLIGPGLTTGLNYYLSKSREAAKVERYRVGIEERVSLAGLKEALGQQGLAVSTVANGRASAEAKQIDFGVVVSGASTAPKVEVFSDNSELKIQMATRRVTDVIERMRDARVKADLQARQVPASILDPFTIRAVNIAQPRKMTGSTLGTMLAFVLLIFLFNGAMYAAVDMTAGEKERRTLEMLLSSAASREEIVCGKVLMAIVTALTTAFFSIASYAVAFALTGRNEISLPVDGATLSLLGLSVIPIAVFAAAMSVAMATPAKSSREAMSYLTPVLFLIMFLAISTLLPEMQKNPLASLIPIANFARMLRQLLVGEWSLGQYVLTFAANLFYAGLAITFAAHKFRDERVLFRN